MVATASLELGIDIGRLDRIIQIGAPMSVSAFVQRLGRSGRRSGISQMYFCSQEVPSAADSPLDRIPWTLVKTIAIIQLYLEEQWTEDAGYKPLPYSLLCHQTLAVLGSIGEQKEEELCAVVLSFPPFGEITKQDYLELLLCLEKGGYIEKTEEGKYIVGLEGERIINHYTFYSVFPDEQEFRVLYMGNELGRVNFIPPEGSGLVLGGRYWRVEDLRLKNREICVIPGGEQGAQIWRGGTGTLHTKVVQRMRQVLLEKRQYPYLTAGAARRLGEGREFAAEVKIGGSIFPDLQQQDGRKSGSGAHSNFFMLPWIGSRGIRTLSLLMQKKENREILKITRLEQENPYAYRIASGMAAEDFQNELKRIIGNTANAETLVNPERIPFTDKYDYLLPPKFLIKQYAANMLCLAELDFLY